MLLSIQSGAYSAGVPKIGTDFSVATVELINNSTLRVWYTDPPVLGSSKANDKVSYSLSGRTIDLATASSHDVRAIDLYLSQDLTPGQWTLSFNSTNIVRLYDSSALSSNSTYVFDVVDKNQDREGVENDQNATRKLFNPAYLGKPVWEAVLGSLEDNRVRLETFANLSFDQGFFVSASGKYLSTRAANYGVEKPNVLGLGDETFRKLALSIVNKKLTKLAKLDLLEIAYGTESTHANLTSGAVEPFALFDKATLVFNLDGKTVIPITFDWRDFSNPLRAFADEVVAVINRHFENFRNTAFAETFTDLATGQKRVRVFSGTVGLRSSIAVISGTAQHALKFDIQLYDSVDATLTPDPGVVIAKLPSWKATVSIDLNSAKIREIFTNVVVGDYINIIGSEFSLGNRGSFIVEDVFTTGSISAGTGVFKISNPSAVDETVTPLTQNSLTIWRPSTRTIYDTITYAYANSQDGKAFASIPTTTRLVSRNSKTASYFDRINGQDILSISRKPSGITTLSTAMEFSDMVLIENFVPKLATASDLVVSTGTPATPSSVNGTSDSSYVSRCSKNTYLTGTLPTCVSDLRGNVLVFGGRNVDGTGNFAPLSQTARGWSDMCAAPNGDVYACVNGGDIYKQTGGTGNFVALSQTPRQWRGMCAAPNGDVYAAVSGADIYKQTGGTGDFVALSQTSRSWHGMCAAPNGDVYASVFNADIYKQTGGTGNFVALSQTPIQWYGMCAAPNGDVYAAVSGADVYKITNPDTKKVSKYAINSITASNEAVSHSYTCSTYSNTNICGVGSALAVLDNARFYNKVLVVGGFPNGPAQAPGASYVSAKSYLYAPDSNTYTEITGTAPTGVANAGIVWLSTEKKVVIAGGVSSTGQATKTACFWDSTYYTDSQLGIWRNGSGTELLYARSEPKLVNLGSNKVLVIGGRVPNNSNSFTLNNIGTPLNTCEIITPVTGWGTASQLTGPMTYARFAFGVVKLPDSRVLVVGGIGAKYTNPITVTDSQQNHELKSCEIYDPLLGYWSPIPDTLEPHSYCTCNYDPNTNRVYICGGVSSTKVEYLDLATMTWKLSTSTLPLKSFRAGTAMSFKDPLRPIIVRAGGSYIEDSTEHNTAQIMAIQLAAESVRSNGINGLHRLSSSTTLTTAQGYTKQDTAKPPYIMSFKSRSDRTILGPYILDRGGAAIMGKQFVLETVIPKGQGAPSVSVTGDLTEIPNSGYLLINYGYKNQAGPVHYIVRGTNALVLDPSFDFPFKLAVGSVLSILSSNAAYLPTLSKQSGILCLTASNAGLAMTKQYLTEISACGIDFIINVRYPGDRGLGNEGLPEGGSKVSDIVRAFGPDELDLYLKEVKNVQ